jgi:hypothetical protein
MIMKNFKAVLTPEQFSYLLSSLTANAKDVVIKKHVIEEEDVNDELEELLAALVEGFKEEEKEEEYKEPCQCEYCKCEGVQWPNYEANYKIPTDTVYKFDMDAFKKLSDEDIEKIGKATQCVDHVDYSNNDEDYNLADVIDDRDLFDLMAEFHLKLIEKYPKKPKTASKLAAKHTIALMSEYLKIDE